MNMRRQDSLFRHQSQAEKTQRKSSEHPYQPSPVRILIDRAFSHRYRALVEGDTIPRRQPWWHTVKNMRRQDSLFLHQSQAEKTQRKSSELPYQPSPVRILIDKAFSHRYRALVEGDTIARREPWWRTVKSKA
jgi:hypothetical protein